ncbi:helix-turn-helix domain-containing protein [Paractinoplanes maris]|uniref:AraC-like ligand-binding domain-containing protein n=1 Tax=Paractinoplanes maris TaxID=1734446 RepID=UPI002021F87F|nr:helix-turn-helix domain-containing protein [Actinoplanes maris]
MLFLTESTGDLDEARSIIARHFYTNFVDTLSARRDWRARFGIAPAGPVTLGDLSFGTDIRMQFGDLGAYHVDVPLSGAVTWRQGNNLAHTATTSSAAVFQPVGDTTLERWSGDCRLLAVKIDKQALENHLAVLLDAPVPGPVRLGPALDLTSAAGASWRNLLRLVAVESARSGGLLHHPVLGARLREDLITGLLLAADHPYREALHRPRPTLAAPRTVRRVVELMRAEPSRPYTVVELARVAGVSPRSLQLSFRRYLGMSPLSYLRELRLGLAHELLIEADPAQTTVADIADQAGFPHPSRFAAAYHHRYGVYPSETLRR